LTEELVEPVRREVHERLHRDEPAGGLADPDDPGSARPFEFFADAREQPAVIVCNIGRFHPYPFTIDHLREPPNLQPACRGQGFGVVQEGVSVMSDADEQDVRSEIMQPAKRRVSANGEFQRMRRHDMVRVASVGGYGHLGVGASDAARKLAKSLGYRTHF
jgi:hypothetical protein